MKLDKYEILVVRACKQFSDHTRTYSRINAIYNMSCSLPRQENHATQQDIINFLLVVSEKLNGEMSAEYLIDSLFKYSYDTHYRTISFENMYRVLFSTIRYAPANSLLNYITPLWFKNYQKNNSLILLDKIFTVHTHTKRFHKMKYTHEQQKANLSKLLNFLKKLPDENFNITHWTLNNTLPPDYTTGYPNPLEHPECNSVCCAIGWCPTIFEEWSWGANGYTPRLKNGYYSSGINTGPLRPLDSAHQFFGVSEIFFDDYYYNRNIVIEDEITKKHLIKEIEIILTSK